MLTEASWRAVDPRSATATGDEYHDARPHGVDEVVEGATSSRRELASTSPELRSSLLIGIADRIEQDAEALIAAADRETALGRPRLEGELVRTTGQLRRFADLAARSAWMDVVIDRGAGQTTGLRRLHVPLGVVAVFTASNFPFAFSVAGGDTASALAVGCPVVVKAHPGHPLTSDLSAACVREAVRAVGLPEGTFGMVHGAGNAVGERLVRHPSVDAVAFTGSLQGGRALYDLAAGRARPIPVYAEMGSLNPVVVTADAMRKRADVVIGQLADSFTLGTGQFCTKPGVLFTPAGDAHRLATGLATAVAGRSGFMLTSRMATTLGEMIQHDATLDGVEVVLAPAAPTSETLSQEPAVLLTTLDALRRHAAPLLDEHFGPVTIIVGIPEDLPMATALDVLPGSLTATLFAEPGEAGMPGLLARLGELAGRVIVDGVPTGVAVSPAQAHTGPYPASSSSAHTAVGDEAFRRFVRPVAFQDVPEDWLPPPVRDANPWEVPQRVAASNE